MTKKKKISTYMTGTIQGGQIPKALNPKHFLIDDRNILQLLNYGAGIGSVLDYYNLENKKSGTWNSLLLADVSILTAHIAQCDISNHYGPFLDFLHAFNNKLSIQRAKSFSQGLFQHGFEAIIQLDQWYKLSNQNFSSNAITIFLEEIIQTQGKILLNTFYRFYFTLVEQIPDYQNKILKPFQYLDPRWEFNPFPDISLEKITGPDTYSHICKTVIQASESGQLLFNLLTQVIEYASDQFEISLQRNDIPPHASLLLTFLNLFQYQQRAINKLTEKHLDFFYQQVLQAKKEPALPDRTFLTLELEKGKTDLLVPKASILQAGNDSAGNPISFKTLKDHTITATQIVQYQTLNFSSASTGNISLGTVENFNHLKNKPWPIFGSNKNVGNLTIKPTTLGLAFSNANLMLAQGKREITMKLFFSSDSKISFGDSSLDNYFSLELSSTKGWCEVKNGKIDYTQADHAITYTFTLTTSDPSIIPYNEKLHGSGYDTPWPIAKITLLEQGIKNYQNLKPLSLSHLSISSTVSGYNNFLVENDSGKLSPTKPFIPFNDPSPGANLYFGSQELFIKPLSYLNIQVAWDRLPPSFKEYYQAYNDFYNPKKSKKPPVFQNQSFQAQLFVAGINQWTPVGNGTTTPCQLFTKNTTVSASEIPLVPKGIKEFKIQGPLPFNPNEPAYTSLGKIPNQNTYKLTLSAPSKGFGAEDYPTILSTVTLQNSVATVHNSRVIVFSKDHTKPLPKVPYVPKIKSMQITYGSHQDYTVTNGQSDIKWYHIHPMGVQPIEPQQEAIPLFPEYQQNAYAYFGLDSVLPGTILSLFLSIHNTTKSIGPEDSLKVYYEYKTQTGWKSLEISSDQTMGFQRNGIISFNIPDDISSLGADIPQGYYWIRLSHSNPKSITTSFIATQALCAERILSKDTRYEPIPEGAITKFKTALAGIKKVLQPEASFGGKPEQTTSEFRNQVAGRLRFKNRATTLQDIEGILLNAFPQLYKISAIPSQSNQPSHAGLVQVVVVPWTTLHKENTYSPQTTIDTMADILTLLQSRGIPSATFEVTNPDFYKLKVSTQVSFSNPAKTNQYIQTLNEDLKNFLSPWIEDNPVQKVPSDFSSSQLYAFIKARPFIENILQFTYTIVSPDEQEPQNLTIEDWRQQHPKGLIVSALKHTIHTAPLPQFSSPSSDGLRIGETFYIN